MSPVYQVLRRKDWQTREDVERRVHGIICVVDADDGRIGREAGDDGVHDRASRLAGTRAIHRIR